MCDYIPVDGRGACRPANSRAQSAAANHTNTLHKMTAIIHIDITRNVAAMRSAVEAAMETAERFGEDTTDCLDRFDEACTYTTWEGQFHDTEHAWEAVVAAMRCCTYWALLLGGSSYDKFVELDAKLLGPQRAPLTDRERMVLDM